MTPLGQYILDEHGEPVRCDDLIAWSHWFEKAERTVARDEIGDVTVSTVFLGVDHAFFGGPPVLWETMVFGGHLDGDQERYTSRADAVAWHAEVVARVIAIERGALRSMPPHRRYLPPPLRLLSSSSVRQIADAPPMTWPSEFRINSM